MENNKIGKIFKQLFPTMFNFIKETKQKLGYEHFAINLQSFEWNIIKKILDKLYSNGISAINLHDAIIFPESTDSNKVEQIITDVYLNEVKIVPTIKTELF